MSVNIHTIWRRVCSLLMVACIVASNMPVQGKSAAAKSFIMSVDGDNATYGSRWVTLIYTELFKRLGIPFQMEHYTLSRRAALVEAGLIDGETSRVYSYGDTHPYLIRVEESLIDLDFSLYTANPALHLARLEDLGTTNYLVEYRRGILICEHSIKKMVPAERVSDVLTQRQGLTKLLSGRTDLYCDIDLYVRQEMQSPELKGAPRVRKVISIGEAVPTYPYLNKKYADLAPRMATVLKQMKAEGLIEAYRLQVERDLGWKQ